jgi:hypothetical protein
MVPEGGRYDPTENKYPNILYTISKGERPDQVTKDQKSFPEPGKYNIGGDFGEDGPKYTMGFTHLAKPGDNFPSPGDYDPNT